MTERQLNSQQLQAVEHNTGPLMIIAGAGTGKTTVVTERIKHLLLSKNIQPEKILALTFTEKAALEMEERIDQIIPYGYTQLWIFTFHAFCDSLLRDEAINIGIDPHYKLTTPAESVYFLRKNIFKLKLNYFRPLGNPNKFLEALLQHFSRLKDEDITPSDYQQWVQNQILTSKTDQNLELQKYKELSDAYAIYENLKIQEGILDFSDLITQALRLFRQRPNILKAYQDKFDYVLIDEFQDTNYAQNQLAILLTGDKKNITVVGDDDQAIYRWRGASVSNMLEFKKNFPQTQIVTLTQNYRSSANILDSAYQLIQQNNPDRLEVKENIDKKLIPMTKNTNSQVELILTDTGENEAEEVIKIIQKLIAKKYEFKDFAILVRANDHAQPFMRALDRHAVPFQFLGPNQLFQKEEIKDLIAYLKVLYNFEDSTSLYRVLTMSVWNINPTVIAMLLNISKKRNLTLFEILNQIQSLSIEEKSKQNLEKIASLIKSHLQKVPTQSAGQILFDFLKESGLFQTYIDIASSADEIKAQNIALFFEKIKSFEANHQDISVFAVVDWIDLSGQMGESPLSQESWAENNAVNILTVHSSKGLEFKVVFVVNLVTQRFPSREKKEQIPIPQDMIKEILPEKDYHLEEERRLCYVAMTRAREKLFLTAAKTYGDGKRERKLSPFVVEALGPEAIQKTLLKTSSQKQQLSLLDLFNQNDSPAPISNLKPQTHHLTYVSYSQLQTFDVCPLHYKLAYILKIPTPPNPSLAFGTSIHAALRDYYQALIRNDKPSLDQIDSLLKNNWEPIGYQSREHEKESFDYAVFTLKKYLTSNGELIHTPLAVELPFQFYNKSIKVGGHIDRIDRTGEDSIEIIDYKTGKNVPTEKEIQENFQLTLYSLAAIEMKNQNFPKNPENIKLSLHYLEEDKILSTTRTLDQLELARAEIISRVEQIESSDFQCSRSILCQNCEYKMLCQNTK